MGNALRNERPERSLEELIVGRSEGTTRLRHTVSRVAESNASVLICGKSGCGKEVVARAIHATSPRAAGPFVAVNCGAIPPELIESELFGHERGSFTGAHARRTGKFEEADGGTLFLDEIGDMRFDMQVKLLRVLEERRFTRVGGNQEIAVNVRIISATHQDLGAAIANGRFREDLYFRLGVVPIFVPDLASRPDDLMPLIQHFERTMALGSRLRLSNAALARLQAHGWPGNVRELRNFVERVSVLYPDTIIGQAEVEQMLGFPRNIREPAASEPASHLGAEPRLDAAAPADLSIGSPIDLKQMLESFELERIQAALCVADGVVAEAARLLTLKRTTLIEKMRKYAIS